MKIRTANSSDIQWMADCQVKMAMETENYELSLEQVTKGVTHVVNNPMIGHYLIVEENDEKVAMMMVLKEWSDWRNGTVLWIHSVFVSSNFRKKGVFKMLYEHLKNIVNEKEELKGLRLFVDKTNLRAIKVYKKIGMTNEHYELFEWVKS